MTQQQAIAELRSEVRDLLERIRQLEGQIHGAAPRHVRLARKEGSPTGLSQPIIFLTGTESDRQLTSKFNALQLSGDQLMAFEQDGQWFYCPCGGTSESDDSCARCLDGLPDPLTILISGVVDGTGPAGTADVINGTHELAALTPGCTRDISLSVPNDEVITITFDVLNPSPGLYQYRMIFEEQQGTFAQHIVFNSDSVPPSSTGVKPDCYAVYNHMNNVTLDNSEVGIHPDYSGMTIQVNESMSGGIVFRKATNAALAYAIEGEPIYDTTQQRMWIGDNNGTKHRVHALDAASVDDDGSMITDNGEIVWDY